MSRARVTLDLTVLEAEAIHGALLEANQHRELWDRLFYTASRRAAALRVLEKARAATNEALEAEG